MEIWKAEIPCRDCEICEREFTKNNPIYKLKSESYVRLCKECIEDIVDHFKEEVAND